MLTSARVKLPFLFLFQNLTQISFFSYRVKFHFNTEHIRADSPYWIYKYIDQAAQSSFNTERIMGEIGINIASNISLVTYLGARWHLDDKYGAPH